METFYKLLPNAKVRGKVLIRRVTDGKVARCLLSYLELVEGDTYVAKSNTKAIRLDGLEWVTETEGVAV